MRNSKLLAATLALSAAASAAATPKGLDARPHFGGTSGKVCKASLARRVVGRTATLARLKEARDLAGAAGARWIRPGESVTQDHRADRLNVRVNKASKISELRCW